MRTKNERFWASVSLRLRSKISVISSACSFSSNSDAKSVIMSQAISAQIEKMELELEYGNGGRREWSHTNVIFIGILCDGTESNDVLFIDRSGYHVQFSRCIDVAQQFFVQSVRTDQAKAHQTQLKSVWIWMQASVRQTSIASPLTLTSLQISNRLSFLTRSSNCLAKWMWWRM